MFFNQIAFDSKKRKLKHGQDRSAVTLQTFLPCFSFHHICLVFYWLFGTIFRRLKQLYPNLNGTLQCDFFEVFTKLQLCDLHSNLKSLWTKIAGLARREENPPFLKENRLRLRTCYSQRVASKTEEVSTIHNSM